jgi:hypothetical protein
MTTLQIPESVQKEFNELAFIELAETINDITYSLTPSGDTPDFEYISADAQAFYDDLVSVSDRIALIKWLADGLSYLANDSNQTLNLETPTPSTEPTSDSFAETLDRALGVLTMPYTIEEVQQEALKFLQRLATEYGSIVSTGVCTPDEIASARAESRFFVDHEGLGYILCTPKIYKQSAQRLMREPLKPDGEIQDPFTQLN